MNKETVAEKFIREFTESFAKFNIKITALTFDETFMTKTEKIQFLVRTIDEINSIHKSINTQLKEIK